jgi:MFS family permease
LSTKESYEKYPHTAFVLALVAGLLIVASGSIALIWDYADNPFRTRMFPPKNITEGANPPPPPSASIRPPRNFGPRPGSQPLVFGGLAAFALGSGVVVLVSAVMLRRTQEKNATWGALILVFSVLSFFGLGGFIVGAVIGIIAGALVLGWRPRKEDMEANV